MTVKGMYWKYGPDYRYSTRSKESQLVLKEALEEYSKTFRPARLQAIARQELLKLEKLIHDREQGPVMGSKT